MKEGAESVQPLPPQLQGQVRAWLRQLALLLPQTPGGTVASLRALAIQLRVPPDVVRHYGKVSSFIYHTDGLSWVGQYLTNTGYEFRLDPWLHAELLREVAAEGIGTQHMH